METFEILYPSPALTPYIRYYWSLKADYNTSLCERIIPTGCISLIFHKANPIFSKTEGRFQSIAFVCGLSDNFTELESSGLTEMIVVVFEPFGAKSFFSIPINEFYNESISVSDLENVLLNDLQNRVQDEPDNKKCITLIEDYLIKKLCRTSDYNYKRISAAINLINYNPLIDISSLSQTACLSYKQFARVFTEYVGARPKEFTRVVRFQRALFLLQTAADMSLAQLSAESGYYDQPHLIREFKSFSGYTPSELLSISRPYSDYFSTLR